MSSKWSLPSPELPCTGLRLEKERDEDKKNLVTDSTKKKMQACRQSQLGRAEEKGKEQATVGVTGYDFMCPSAQTQHKNGDLRKI